MESTGRSNVEDFVLGRVYVGIEHSTLPPKFKLFWELLITTTEEAAQSLQKALKTVWPGWSFDPTNIGMNLHGGYITTAANLASHRLHSKVNRPRGLPRGEGGCVLLRPELVNLYRALSLDQTAETRRLLRHFVELDILSEDYAAAVDQRLGRKMADKRRIYLDQCWWNFMRDAQAGSPQHPAHPEILELLTSLVDSGRAVCPVSFAIFEETIKQGDRARRRATASVVDRLSRGVALRTLDELIVREARLVFRSLLGGSEPTTAYCELGWTHVAELAGQYRQDVDGWTAVEKNLHRKVMFDVTRSTSFAATIESTIELMGRCKQDEQRFNSWIDDQCEAHRREFATFEGLLAIEVNGGIDACADLLVRALDLEMTAEQRVGLSSATEADLRLCLNCVCNVIDHELLRGRVHRLPSLHVVSVLHATRRWTKQKARLGDRDDHKHAALALGYCDLFLTEKHLTHTLTSGPGNLAAIYGCEVLANGDQVAERLRLEVRDVAPRSNHHPTVANVVKL